MKEKYVIAIKSRKDFNGKDCEEWRYVGRGGSGIPFWALSDLGILIFPTVEVAEEWFLSNKRYLFEEYTKKYEFDMSTLSIMKIKIDYVVAKTLEI